MSISRLSLTYRVSDGPNLLEEAMALADVGHHLLGLGNHFQRQIVADGDAFRAALALAGVDHDREHPAFADSSWPGLRSTCGSSTIACGTSSRSAGSEIAASRFFEFAFAEHLAQDGRVGAERDAIHAAGAVAGNVLRDIRGDVAEIAQRRRAGRNQRAGDRQIGRPSPFRPSLLRSRE